MHFRRKEPYDRELGKVPEYAEKCGNFYLKLEFRNTAIAYQEPRDNVERRRL